MSGFAAIVHFDGAPVLPQAAAGLARSLRFRAPDGEATECLDGVGFAYAEMTIAGDPPPALRPLCLDDRWWIVGHIRFYERDDLVRALQGTGASARLDQPDAW